jgi:hypothetical protein
MTISEASTAQKTGQPMNTLLAIIDGALNASQTVAVMKRAATSGNSQ